MNTTHSIEKITIMALTSFHTYRWEVERDLEKAMRCLGFRKTQNQDFVLLTTVSPDERNCFEPGSYAGIFFCERSQKKSPFQSCLLPVLIFNGRININPIRKKILVDPFFLTENILDAADQESKGEMSKTFMEFLDDLHETEDIEPF